MQRHKGLQIHILLGEILSSIAEACAKQDHNIYHIQMSYAKTNEQQVLQVLNT
jgi:hypothetical protein